MKYLLGDRPGLGAVQGSGSLQWAEEKMLSFGASVEPDIKLEAAQMITDCEKRG